MSLQGPWLGNGLPRASMSPPLWECPFSLLSLFSQRPQSHWIRAGAALGASFANYICNDLTPNKVPSCASASRTSTSECGEQNSPYNGAGRRAGPPPPVTLAPNFLPPLAAPPRHMPWTFSSFSTLGACKALTVTEGRAGSGVLLSARQGEEGPWRGHRRLRGSLASQLQEAFPGMRQTTRPWVAHLLTSTYLIMLFALAHPH